MLCLVPSKLGSEVRSATASMGTRTDSEHDSEYDSEWRVGYGGVMIARARGRVGYSGVAIAGGRRWGVEGVGMPRGASLSAWGSTSSDVWLRRKRGAVVGRCCLFLLRSTCAHGGLNGSCRRTGHELRI